MMSPGILVAIAAVQTRMVSTTTIRRVSNAHTHIELVVNRGMELAPRASRATTSGAKLSKKNKTIT